MQAFTRRFMPILMVIALIGGAAGLQAQDLNVATVTIPSGNTVMFGSMFSGEGPAPRPTVLLL